MYTWSIFFIIALLVDCKMVSHCGLYLHFHHGSFRSEFCALPQTNRTFQLQAVRVSPGTGVEWRVAVKSHSRGRHGFQRKFGVLLVARRRI